MQVLVDGSAVDGFDHRAEHLPPGDRVVSGLGAGLPGRRGGGDPGEHLGGREVGVEVGAPVHREATGVGEHVAQGAALLAVAPAGDEVTDLVVEPEAALLPQLEDRHRGQGLARRVPEHDVVGRQRPTGPRLAHGGVEQGLAAERHVDLGAVVEVLLALVFQDLQHRGAINVTWVKSGAHGAEA